MNFTCDNCQRRYSIADDKVRGKTVKVRCRNCSNLISVSGPADEPEEREERTAMMSLEQVEKLRTQGRTGAASAAAVSPPAPAARQPWDDEPTAAAPPLEMKAEWFAMVRGKQTGPMDPRGLAELVRTNELTPKSYVWRKGMAEWKRGSDVPELITVFSGTLPSSLAASAPPIPPPAASAPSAAVEAEPVRSVAAPARAAAAAPVADTATPFGRAGASSDPLPFDDSPEPAAEPARSMSLGELFSDADLASSQGDGAGGDGASAPSSENPVGVAGSGSAADDPFAALGEIDPEKLPPPGEATRFFIAQAGVNKRNPPWKIAAFILGGVGAVAGVIFLLGSLNVVPLRVTTVDASGQEVEQSVFSADGVSAFGDILLGRKNAKKPATPGPAKPQNVARAQTGDSGARDPGTNMPKVEGPKTHVPTQEELAALYGDGSKADRGPKVRKDAETKATNSSTDGLSQEQISKVVTQNQAAFQSCIEQELRKNPNLKVGKVFIRATIGSSGVVKSAAIDHKDLKGSNLAECLTSRTKRMVFAQFAGEDIDIEFPLIVGVAM